MNIISRKPQILICNVVKIFSYIFLFHFATAEFMVLLAESFNISPVLGKNIIDSARNSAGLGSTTFCRKEQKSVIHKDLFARMLESLKAEDINLLNRDQGDFGNKNSTFTIYSHAAKFSQGRVKTSIRLRSRFYVNQIQPYTPPKKGKEENYVIDAQLYQDLCGFCSIEETSRSEITSDSGFLEIKIKNPSEEEENSVLKIRMHVQDHLLIRLYNVDPHNETDFNELLEELSLNLVEKNKESHVKSIVEVIRILGRIHSGFIRPEFAVSYQRNAFAFTDQSIQPLQELQPGTPTGEILKYPTFQVTIDKNIRYHEINRFGNFLNIVSYYEDDSALIGTYPEDALALEFKDPVRTSANHRTKVHQKLLDTFVTMAQDKGNIFHGFRANNGKAANYKNMVTFKDRFQYSNWEESF